MDFSERFSGKAGDYTRYRPKYPTALSDFLKRETLLSPTDIVADIGSGTGISSEIFIENGNTVYAIEPNDDMRHAAERVFKNQPRLVSIKASAEHTTLPDQSVNLIFAGTSFHWFDIPETQKEFQRILKDRGHIVISWNMRDSDDPFQQRLNELFARNIEKLTKVEQQKDAEAVHTFFGTQSPGHIILKNTQRFSFPELMGRMRSSSYFPPEDSSLYSRVEEQINDIFRIFQENGKISFNYKTHVYWV